MLIDSFENKEKIINNLIEIAEFEGWSNESLRHAFNKSFIDEKYIDIIFENKIFSAIEFISFLRCEEVKKQIDNKDDFFSKNIGEKISFLLFNILNFSKHQKISFKRLLNFYLNPKNILEFQNGSNSKYKHALKETYKVADFIWKLCNDKSTDINFFSKRLILSKIIICSYIYSVNNESNDSLNLQYFIDKQIKNVLKINSFKLMLKQKKSLLKNKIEDILINQNNDIKNHLNHKKLIQNLPFIRLIKKNFK